MLRFGFCTQDQYLRAGDRRRLAGARAAYTLLDVGDHPTEQQIRVFEDVSFSLRTSNGTTRTTFRRRFRDIDEVSMRWIERSYPADTELRVQDRAASHGLTSWEWAEPLFRAYPRAEMEVSDALLHLTKLTLPSGEVYITEPGGKPLQYIKAPFVVSVDYPESWRYPVNRLIIAARAKQRFEQLDLPDGWTETSGGRGYLVGKIPCSHPEARLFSKNNSRFQFRVRSVFECTPDSCHVLRTMNIFNRAYFSTEKLAEGANAAFQSLKPGGIWIVGRTLEEDFSNHATLLRRREDGWEVLERIGGGSEMEQVALGAPALSRDGASLNEVLR